MNTLIVVESYWGNTHAIAEAIAAEIPGAAITDAAHAPAHLAGMNLVIVGSPTHNMTLPSPSSRKRVRDAGLAAPERGIREWLADATGSARLVTFDTSTKGGTLLGSASKKAATLARRRGFQAERGESFLVAGAPPKLAGSELDRAREWARRLRG